MVWYWRVARMHRCQSSPRRTLSRHGAARSHAVGLPRKRQGGRARRAWPYVSACRRFSRACARGLGSSLAQRTSRKPSRSPPGTRCCAIASLANSALRARREGRSATWSAALGRREHEAEACGAPAALRVGHERQPLVVRHVHARQRAPLGELRLQQLLRLGRPARHWPEKLVKTSPPNALADAAYLQAGPHVTHDAAVVDIQRAAVALEGPRAQAVVARLRHLAPPKYVH